MLIDLNGKVAVVTGAGRGIGRVIARTMASEGATVLTNDIDRDNLADLDREFAEQGWPGKRYECDVREATQIQEMVDQIVAEYGRIDILVNNAGVSLGGPVETLEETSWDLNMDTNLKGVFLMSKAVVPVMKRQRSGRILNAASFGAIVPIVGSAAYSASKAGVVLFTRALAGELGPWNITVNCYSPGMIPTQMNHFAELPTDRQNRLLDTLTLRHWGEAKEVAQLLCFLSSDLAGYITGTMIDISGGKLATQIPQIAYERAQMEERESL